MVSSLSLFPSFSLTNSLSSCFSLSLFFIELTESTVVLFPRISVQHFSNTTKGIRTEYSLSIVCHSRILCFTDTTTFSALFLSRSLSLSLSLSLHLSLILSLSISLSIYLSIYLSLSMLLRNGVTTVLFLRISAQHFSNTPKGIMPEN